MSFLIFIIYIVLLILNMYYSVKGTTNKSILTITYLLIGILFVGNSGMYGDAVKYKLDYEQNAFGDGWGEIGYEILKKICRLIGIDKYNVFLLVIFILSSILFYIGFKNLYLKWHVIFAISMIFIVPTAATVIRYTLALSIVVFSLQYLFKNETIKYIALVFISSLFHKSMIIFALFALVRKNYKNINANQLKNIKTTLLVFMFSFAIIASVFNKIPLLDIALYTMQHLFNIDINKINAYFNGNFTRLGGFIFYPIYIIGLILNNQIYNDITKIKNQSMQTIIYMSNTINYLSSCFIPLIAINLVFYRYLILVSFINAFIYSIYKRNVYYNESKIRITNHLSISNIDILFILYCLSWLFPEIMHIHSISIFGLVKDLFIFI